VAKTKTRTYVVLSDLQIPFADNKAVGLALDFIDSIKPDGVVLAGDIVDCYSLSTFDKRPITKATLEDEIRLARDLMARLKKIKEKVWLGGNHEFRLERHLAANPNLWQPLDAASRKRISEALSFPVVFGLADFGFKWLPYGDVHKLGRLTVTHGNQVRQDSGQSAKAHFLKYGVSVLHGHTHRLGVYYRTNSTGVHGAWENGCLCSTNPEYVQQPDWQQGWSVVHVGKSGLYNVQQVAVLPGYQIFFGTKNYKAA